MQHSIPWGLERHFMAHLWHRYMQSNQSERTESETQEWTTTKRRRQRGLLCCQHKRKHHCHALAWQFSHPHGIDLCWPVPWRCRKRCLKKEKTMISVQRPFTINMGGVDLVDQCVTMYPHRRRNKRVHPSVFFFIFWMWLLLMPGVSTWRLDLQSFWGLCTNKCWQMQTDATMLPAQRRPNTSACGAAWHCALDA